MNQEEIDNALREANIYDDSLTDETKATLAQFLEEARESVRKQKEERDYILGMQERIMEETLAKSTHKESDDSSSSSSREDNESWVTISNCPAIKSRMSVSKIHTQDEEEEDDDLFLVSREKENHSHQSERTKPKYFPRVRQKTQSVERKLHECIKPAKTFRPKNTGASRTTIPSSVNKNRTTSTTTTSTLMQSENSDSDLVLANQESHKLHHSPLASQESPKVHKLHHLSLASQESQKVHKVDHSPVLASQGSRKVHKVHHSPALASQESRKVRHSCLYPRVIIVPFPQVCSPIKNTTTAITTTATTTISTPTATTPSPPLHKESVEPATPPNISPGSDCKVNIAKFCPIGVFSSRSDEAPPLRKKKSLPSEAPDKVFHRTPNESIEQCRDRILNLINNMALCLQQYQSNLPLKKWSKPLIVKKRLLVSSPESEQRQEFQPLEQDIEREESGGTTPNQRSEVKTQPEQCKRITLDSDWDNSDIECHVESSVIKKHLCNTGSNTLSRQRNDAAASTSKEKERRLLDDEVTQPAITKYSQGVQRPPNKRRKTLNTLEQERSPMDKIYTEPAVTSPSTALFEELWESQRRPNRDEKEKEKMVPCPLCQRLFSMQQIEYCMVLNVRCPYFTLICLAQVPHASNSRPC